MWHLTFELLEVGTRGLDLAAHFRMRRSMPGVEAKREVLRVSTCEYEDVSLTCEGGAQLPRARGRRRNGECQSSSDHRKRLELFWPDVA